MTKDRKSAQKQAQSFAIKAVKQEKSSPYTMGSLKVSKAKSSLVFGVNPSATQDVEDTSSMFAPVAKYAILALICLMSFAIRLFSVVRYESVIHEFDPYFNYRATKYLALEGFMDFLDWFDDRAWYPLGRVIGGTIYPGLMFTAAVLHYVLHFLNMSVSVRNTCVLLAPVFAALTVISTYLLTKEVTKRNSAALLAAAFVGVVPSYISRSVGGSYDNEGVAIFALVFVFYLWIKAVHTGSMIWAASSSIAYFYMVAAWGGFVFIINMIPIYVIVMMVAGRFSQRLYVAYSTFYVLGSLMAMQVPFVSFGVVTQAECAGSHGVFILIQIYAFALWIRSFVSADSFRRLIINGAVAAVSIVAIVLLALQLTGRLRWAGRSLTLLDPTYASKYMPIVASVSEHQPTTWTSYIFDLHILVPFSLVGLYHLYNNLTDGGIFVILYGTISWYFSSVMVRLMLTLAPAASILAGIGISTTLRRLVGVLYQQKKNSSKGTFGIAILIPIAGLLMLMLSYSHHANFVASFAYSSPSIVIDGGVAPSGERMLLDDYREAYFWLRQNTDPHARIMSWWDYGYQMSALANRTVIVDNNTWNNTHIATVGRALASTEENAYPIFQSLDVDYVLVVFGGAANYGSDDINKFLWPIRIGNGVFEGSMPREAEFFAKTGQIDIGPNGSEAFHNSLLYKLCYYRFSEVLTEQRMPRGFDILRNTLVGVENIKLTHVEEAYTSEHWIIRIYKVKKQPIVEPTSGLRKKRIKTAKASPSTVSEKARFLGCVKDENALGNHRSYVGDAAGANINVLLHQATAANARYVAIARSNTNGHAFLIKKLDLSHFKFNGNDAGCRRPCMDDPSSFCGCVDAACEGIIADPGAEHLRRWAVYEVAS